MKISVSIRNLYDEQKLINRDLQVHVESILKETINKQWHYLSRIKELESFALKVETGRSLDEKLRMEDFFACTIVVENYDSIAKAIEIVNDKFTINSRRPENASETHMNPETFQFDDLRLYCCAKKSTYGQPKAYDDVVFEIQIKTFLQHAWGIATHDLIYKSENPTWGTARIAFQVKAMLEHAELSIKQASQLATCPELNKSQKGSTVLTEILTVIKTHWAQDFLPSDHKRLAENIKNLLMSLYKTKLLRTSEVNKLDELLGKGKVHYGGKHPLNLSPYAAIIQYLFIFNRSEIVRILVATGSKKKYFLEADIEIPVGVDVDTFVNAIRIPSTLVL